MTDIDTSAEAVEAAMGYDAATIPEIVSDMRDVAEAEEDVLCRAAADLIETLRDRLVAANGALEICSKSWEECNTQLIAAKAQAQTTRDDALREAAASTVMSDYNYDDERRAWDYARFKILAMIQLTDTSRRDAATEE